MAGKTKVIAEPGKPTILITREFDAPRDLVFEACSKPELVKRWWGPRNTSFVVCQIDFRVGGSWRYVLRGPSGREEGFGGVYREIVPVERIVQTSVFDPFPQAESVETCLLTALGQRTLLTVTVVHKAVEFRDGHVQAGMEGGLQQTHERLDELLATMARAA
jgi:uncharacterized protein YndB with AHSA1/START domain